MSDFLTEFLEFHENKRISVILSNQQRILDKLAHIQGSLTILQGKDNAIMATLEEFNASLDAIEAAEAGIDARIAALQAQIDGGNLTTEQEQAVLDRINTLKAELEADANPPA